jgi:urease accessory protein
MHAELLLMLLADARLPVAGHTQSNTLEAAVRAGLVAADVPGYVRSRLLTVTTVDAATAVVARHLCVTDGAAAELETVERAWAARTASSALRNASRVQGRALLRLVDRLWTGSEPLKAVRALPAPTRMVVLGAVAAEVGLPPVSLARLVGYDDVQTVCAASLKLLPLDPSTVAAWSLAALPYIEKLAVDVAGCSSPVDIPARTHPQIEAWAQVHAHNQRRLFRA